MVVLKCSDQYEVLATNKLSDECFDASPVLVGKELLLRGKEHFVLHHGEMKA